MKTIGIDPSMRSTGICIMTDDTPEYHLICSAPTKKLLNIDCDFIHVHKYEAEPVEGNSVQKEWHKMNNVRTVTNMIRDILGRESPDHCIIEAIAMAAGTHGRIDQLSFLNGCIRYVCLESGIPCYAIAPTSNKLQFTGSGDAKKDDMVRCWKMVDPRLKDYNGYKLDDLADAYALSTIDISLYIDPPL